MLTKRKCTHPAYEIWNSPAAEINSKINFYCFSFSPSEAHDFTENAILDSSRGF